MHDPPEAMPIDAVLDLLRTARALGIDVWLDGGWGVDALVGRVTRTHADVDIVVAQRDAVVLRDHLERRGFRDVPRDDTRPHNFVLGNDAGHRIDFHIVVFDGDGHGVYGPSENGQRYPAHAFAGRGHLGVEPVRCMSATYQIESHAGYPLREKDHADLRLLRSLM